MYAYVCMLGVSGWTDAGTKRCQSPPVVRHGYHNASARRTSFPVGTQLVYRCRRGYNMDGPFRVICVDEGRWVGPHITCSRNCTSFIMLYLHGLNLYFAGYCAIGWAGIPWPCQTQQPYGDQSARKDHVCCNILDPESL